MGAAEGLPFFCTVLYHLLLQSRFINGLAAIFAPGDSHRPKAGALSTWRFLVSQLLRIRKMCARSSVTVKPRWRGFAVDERPKRQRV